MLSSICCLPASLKALTDEAFATWLSPNDFDGPINRYMSRAPDPIGPYSPHSRFVVMFLYDIRRINRHHQDHECPESTALQPSRPHTPWKECLCIR